MIIRPLTEFHKNINDTKVPPNIAILNAIKKTHEFREQQKDYERYYNNFVHNIDFVANEIEFLKEFKKLRYIRAYYKLLMESLNHFEETLLKMQHNNNRNGVLPTMSQLYKLVTIKYRKNTSIDALLDSRIINNILVTSKEDFNLIVCLKEISNDQYTILKHYINRYNTLLNRPNSYVDNERHEKIKQRLAESYYNVRPTTLVKTDVDSLYKELMS